MSLFSTSHFKSFLFANFNVGDFLVAVLQLLDNILQGKPGQQRITSFNQNFS